MKFQPYRLGPGSCTSPCCLFVWFLASILQADDWTQYRGPNHDGISAETVRTNWDAQPPRQLWKVPLGPALSSFTVAGGQVYTQVRRSLSGRDQEFCIALNADTGMELWATPLGKANYPDGGVGSDDGPRSTPAIDGDRVYVLTSYLRLACLDSGTGEILWSKDLVSVFGGEVISWQNAASPLIVGDLIYLNANAPNQCLMALKKLDGSVAWKGQNDNMTQSSPVLATIAGAPQVIFFAQSGLVSVKPDTGDVFWRYPFPFSTATAASPVVAGDIVYCSAAYGGGAGAVRISNTGSRLLPSEVWRAPGAHMNIWATPVHFDGHLYGIYGQGVMRLACLDLATGTEVWSMNGVGTGGVLLVGGLLLVLTDTGDLALVQPDPSAYTEITRFTAVSGKCWNVPAVSNGRVYVRSTTQAAAYDVSLKAPPKLRFSPGLAAAGTGFQLVIGNDDASPLDASRAANIDVLAATNLATGWFLLTNSLTWTNGQFRMLDPADTNVSQRFYKAQERP
jgi:outer membrane protein assembly factor BamB